MSLESLPGPRCCRHRRSAASAGRHGVSRGRAGGVGRRPPPAITATLKKLLPYDWWRSWV
nr:hypothetical protein [Cressdnaviricota sp.]